MSILNPPPPIRGYTWEGQPVYGARKSLLDRISTAIAWGRTDNESTGMSQSELIGLLREARDEIIRLKRS